MAAVASKTVCWRSLACLGCGLLTASSLRVTARDHLEANVTSFESGVIDTVQDVFVKHGKYALLAGHIANTVVPNPVLMTVSLLKQVRNSYEYGRAIDVNGDLWRQIASNGVPRACNRPEDCETSEVCAPVTSELSDGNICKAGNGTAPFEAALSQQYELFNALRDKCTTAAAVDEVLQRSEILGKDAPNVEDLPNDESAECARKRTHVQEMLQRLHDQMAKYNGGKTDGEFYKEMFHYLGGAREDGVERLRCTEHADCGKYQFCASIDKVCRPVATCTSDKSVGTKCPDQPVPPPRAGALCEDGVLDNACCWSTCNAVPYLRSCASVHSGASPAQNAPRNSSSSEGCGFLYNNHRSECCVGEVRVQDTHDGAVGKPGASDYCCPGGSCTKESPQKTVEESFDVDEYTKSLDANLDADVADQVADADFGVLSPLTDEPESSWQMLARRTAVIDAHLRRMEKTCPASVSALFGWGGSTGSGASPPAVLDAAEAARCTEGGFYLKEVMSRWAAVRIMTHVLPVQASWANHYCPQLLEKAKALFVDVEDASRTTFIKKLQIVSLYGRWHTECDPWVGNALEGRLNGETLAWVDGHLVLRSGQVGEHSCGKSCEVAGCCLQSDVTESDVRRFASVAKAADMAQTAALAWIFDKGSLDVITGGAQSVGVGGWIEAAAWLANRGQEIFQNSESTNGDAIQSFCVAAAFHLEGLDRAIPA